MCFFKTNVGSWTGQIIYSDQTWTNFDSDRIVRKGTCLNGLSNVPIFSIGAGAIRSAIACIHIVGHLFATLITRDLGHIAHVVKGLAELVRGILEMIPIIGMIFSYCYNPSYFNCGYYSAMPDGYGGNFFLVKISKENEEELDSIDQMMVRNDKHPFFDSLEEKNRKRNQAIEEGIRGVSPLFPDVLMKNIQEYA